MIIACPACNTRYVVPDSAIGAEGRTVRCAKCKHSWFQDGPDVPLSETPRSDEGFAATADPVGGPVGAVPRPPRRAEPPAHPTIDAEPARTADTAPAQSGVE